MASTTDTLSPNQLKQARTRMWHQDGNALRTGDDARAWLNEAGLVPFYPHAQFAAPQGSFAEAILGRPENGWVPPAPPAAEDGTEESYALEVEDEDPAEEIAEPEDDGSTDEDAVTNPEAAEDEIMLSDDDEFSEDEGDEIAEEDRIHAGGDPLPNDVRAEAASRPDPVNGFSAEEREMVSRTLARMVAEGSAVPLNLLGSATGEPDFICSAQAFSFVYTLRGDKGWKQEPAQTGSMRVSPLAGKVHEVLKEKGVLSPQDLASELSHGVVESAVLRALSELWAILRVIPLGHVDGAPAKWELLTAHHVRHLKAGANAGQPTALSALLSLYLAQVVAATGDEMEIFLSPLAARSRIREVVGALAASRQIDQIVVGGKTLFYMPGALEHLPADQPDEEEMIPAARPRSRYEEDDRRAAIEVERARGAEGGPSEQRRPFNRRPGSGPAGGRDQRAGGSRAASFGGRAQGGFTPQRRSGGFAGSRPEGSFPPRSDDRERRPFQRRDDAATPARTPNEFARPWDEESRGPGRADEGTRAPYVRRDGEGRPAGDRKSFGDRKPFTPREGGGRPYTPRREGDRPYQANSSSERRPFSSGRPAGDRPREDRRPFTPREGGDRRPYTPRENGERRPYTPRENSAERRPFVPREGGDRRPFSPRANNGERRPFTPRGDRPSAPGGDRPYVPREGREERSFRPREDGERPAFAPRGDRPFTPRGDRPFTPPRSGRPFAPREGGDGRSSGDRKPYGAGRNVPAGARPGRFSGEPGEGRPTFQSGAKSSGPGGAKFGGSGFGRDRKGAPGSFGKPGFSPARRGPGSGPGRGGAPKRRPE